MKDQIHMEFIKKLRSIVEPVCERYYFELVDLEYQRESRGWVLRVFVDKVGGVTVEDCAYISEKISKELDIHDPIPHSYVLEVSSPGLDRPLKKRRDFDRHVGEKVNILLLENIEGRRKVEGKIISTDEENVIIEVDGKFIHIPFSKIKKARLIVEF